MKTQISEEELLGTPDLKREICAAMENVHALMGEMLQQMEAVARIGCCMLAEATADEPGARARWHQVHKQKRTRPMILGSSLCPTEDPDPLPTPAALAEIRAKAERSGRKFRKAMRNG